MSKKEKFIGSLVLVIIISFFSILGYHFSYRDNASDNNISAEDIFEEEVEEENDNEIQSDEDTKEVLVDKSKEEFIEEENDEGYIFVEIKGEVSSPGVYKLDKNSRIIDLVDRAGGFNDYAYTRNIALAQKLEDEETIIVFNKDEYKEELELKSIVKSNDSKNDAQQEIDIEENVEAKININTAGKEKLKELPNVGDVTADNIIKYRETVSDFKKIEDIKNVTRIGDKTFDDFKNLICVN